MIQEVEISSLDLRYQSHRIKNAEAEKKLLTSIQENGIREPLQGVDIATPQSTQSTQSTGLTQSRILLNGFKRYRCAKKLSIAIVPYSSLGSDEAFGLITLLKIATLECQNPHYPGTGQFDRPTTQGSQIEYI